jgi:Ras-related protein Rab-5C
MNTKIVMLGDTGVGKSSILSRYIKEEYNPMQESTIGAAFYTKRENLDSNKIVKFDIWDTAGQERYHSLTQMYYRGAKVVFIVYDLGNYNSVNIAKKFIREVKERVNEAIIVVVGNKSDLDNSEKEIPESVYKNFTNNSLVDFHYFVSAKTGSGIPSMFRELAEECFKKFSGDVSLENPLTFPPVEQSRSCC